MSTAKPYPDLGNRPLKSVTASEAAEIFTHFMTQYESKRAQIAPNDLMVVWPTPDELRHEFEEHSPTYAKGMGVDMALNVGGPACRVLYSPSRGNDLSPNEGRNPRMLKLHSRAQNSSNLLNEKWDEELGSQLEPALKRSDSEDRFVLPTHVALPRLLQLASEPFSNGLKTSRRASFFSTGTYSHRILRHDVRLREEWTVLPVQPSDFWKNKVKFDDRLDGSPSSPDMTFLRLDLHPIESRHHQDRFSILFRVRIVFIEGPGWVPWKLGSVGWPSQDQTKWPEPTPTDKWDFQHHFVVRGHPYEPPAAVELPAHHALSHRQRKNYGQTHAGGGSSNSW